MEKGDFFSNFLAQKDLFRGNDLNPESEGIAYSHNFLSKVLGCTEVTGSGEWGIGQLIPVENHVQ